MNRPFKVILLFGFFILSILFGAIGMPSQVVHAAGTVSLTSGITYTEDFDTLASSGTSDILPNGWYFIETGSNQNTTYSAGTGSSTTGDTYSFGLSGNPERAFGELRSGNLIPTLGVSFSNNTGISITSLVITYTGEQWRLGAIGRTDRMDFQYSTNATSLTTGNWTDVDTLDFTAPVTSGTVGLLNGNLASNRTVIRHTITGLNIADGSTFWVRWNDLDSTGSDDGLAVDNFFLSAGYVIDATSADFTAGTLGTCVDGGVGDGSLKLNLPATSCVFESKVHTPDMLVDWSTLASTTTLPTGTSISFEVRTGNTAIPDDSWTNWQAANGTITNPGSQYIQYRATLATTDSGQSPVLESVKINFMSGLISTLISPTGTLTVWNGSFIWTGVAGATWYLLDVYTLGGTQMYRKWYTSEQTGCSADTSCSLTPTDISLPSGDYQWRVMDYGAYGYGIWPQFMNITLNTACYSLSTNVNPAESGAVNLPVQSCPGGYINGSTVQLTAITGTGYKFSSWSGDAAGAISPVSIVMDGNKTVTANMNGNTPLTPTGTLTNWDGSFTWMGLSNASWYLIEVQNSGGTQVFRKWYTSTQTNCSGGTSCLVIPSGLGLANGDYKWRVLDYGEYGYGINSAFKNFTLSGACYSLITNVLPGGGGTVAVPSQTCAGGYTAGSSIQLSAVPNANYVFASWSGDASGLSNPTFVTMNGNKNVTANFNPTAAPLTPADILTSWNNSFTWTGLSNATWYLIEVQTSGGAQVYRKWYTSTQAGCSGGTSCSVTASELGLVNGNYKWRVLDYGAYGYGVNSAFKTFTLDISIVCGDTIFVDADSTAPAPDGCSWGTSYASLQDAISAATSGEQIWVAEGTYYPDRGIGLTPGDREVSFSLKEGVAIYGGFNGNESNLAARDNNPSTNGTVLSGDIGVLGNTADNAYHVVQGEGVTSSAMLDGFTITLGNSNGSSGLGGGIYLSNSSPIIANLAISNNIASANGGGVFVTTVNNLLPEANYSRPAFTDVTISGNIAARGGGLYTQNASPSLTRVAFTGNTATSGAGGGMNNQTLTPTDAPSVPVLTDVTFSGNIANGGGGLFNTYSNGILTRVTFSGNTANRRGGAVLNEFANPVFTNVTFYGNVSTESTGASPWGGGGIMNVDSDPVLNNVTFSGNNSVNGSGTAGGDAIRNSTNSSPVIMNSIFWGDVNDEITSDGTGTTTISNSVVQGGFAGGTNIVTTDPKLGALANNGGLTQTMALGAGSSAVDAGNNSTCAASDQRGVTRPQGLVCDAGAYELDVVLLIAPSGTLGSWNNTFNWTGQSDTTWYLLEIYTSDGSAQIFRKWYTSPQAGCSGGVVCSISPPETTGLASGSYKWKILEYGAYGYGIWTPYLNFTIP